MLQSVRETGQKLNKLEELDVGFNYKCLLISWLCFQLTVRLCIPNLIEELAWFLDFHLNLNTLIFRNLMFASMSQILMFIR